MNLSFKKIWRTYNLYQKYINEGNSIADEYKKLLNTELKDIYNLHSQSEKSIASLASELGIEYANVYKAIRIYKKINNVSISDKTFKNKGIKLNLYDEKFIINNKSFNEIEEEIKILLLKKINEITPNEKIKRLCESEKIIYLLDLIQYRQENLEFYDP